MDQNALFKMSYGMYVLTAKKDERDNGCIVDAAIQITQEPMQMAVCVYKSSYTHELLINSEKYNLSILSEEANIGIYRRFGYQSGRDTDKFDGYPNARRAENGLYYITEGTNAYISVKISEKKDLGTHTMFIGNVEAAEVLSEDPSATYDFYRRIVKA